MKNYTNEAEGRIDFYRELGYQGNPNEELCNVDYSHNTDGVIDGVLFEHKLVINSNSTPLNRVLGQAIKYLSKKRINGVDVPNTIILISQNDEKAYAFSSDKYFKEIHRFYCSSASNDNDMSLNIEGYEEIDYGKNGTSRIKDLIETSDYINVDVDINNVISLARRFYKNNKNAQKNDFLKEIRNPKFFKYINAYTKEIDDNSEFGYIMDKLNDEMLQQEIGAYYTPVEYSEKSLELVRDAIKNRPKGNNYVIIDRCAGTGNLEEKMTEEEISHCVLNTYEYFEWLELRRQYADRALYVIPKSDRTYVRGEGVIKEGDALSEEFYNDKYLRSLISNKNNTIIIFENPPYFSGDKNQSLTVINTASGENGKKRSSKKLDNNWISQRMKANGFNSDAISNTVRQFIWSAYEDFLRQNGDTLIVYSPVSYFRGYHMQDKMIHLKFDKGYGFNRKHFHASPALISCIKWDYNKSHNNSQCDIDTLLIELYDINKFKQLESVVNNEKIEIKRVNTSPAYYFKHRNKENAFGCLGYNGMAPKTGLGCLYSIVESTGKNNENYLNKDNYFNLLPVYIAQLTFDREKWYNEDNTIRSADLGDKYLESDELLRRSLIFTCLYRNNHMQTIAKDGKLYLNQLCFDDNTIAMNKLKTLNLDDRDNRLMQIWSKVLQYARMSNTYKANYKYGMYQIMKELDTYDEVQKGTKIEKKFHYPNLHNNITELNKEVKRYYNELIEPLLFKYELIK